MRGRKDSHTRRHSNCTEQSRGLIHVELMFYASLKVVHLDLPFPLQFLLIHNVAHTGTGGKKTSLWETWLQRGIREAEATATPHPPGPTRGTPALHFSGSAALWPPATAWYRRARLRVCVDRVWPGSSRACDLGPAPHFWGPFPSPINTWGHSENLNPLSSCNPSR